MLLSNQEHFHITIQFRSNMNLLLSKLNEFRAIINYRFIYEFDTGDKLEYRLKQTDFPHLIGLHKLTDIPVIQQFKDSTKANISAKYIVSKIKKEELLTDEIVHTSGCFYKIADRYNNFTKENILTVSYTDAIIDFDPTIAGSSLKAKYILFERKASGGYNNLCIGCSGGIGYAESFFYQPTDRYIAGQKLAAVVKVTIYDEHGNIYFTDRFN